ncbi:MAG: hypothetical protein IMF20_08100 [Proteobacteria bacterium]|nr:hypothetical protein [Pseudomonadota bacterium]
MKITENASYIRQQQPGQFRRPEDAKAPATHMNDQKLVTIRGQKGYSVYVSNEKLVALDRLIEPDFPKLFDFDAGVQFSLEKLNRTHRDEDINPQYDKSAKTEMTTKKEWIIDQWA